jgi:hypothetical protein
VDFIASHKKITIIASIAILVSIVAIVTGILIQRHGAVKTATTAVIETPNYSTILPNNTTIKQLGGWERISPPDTDPVYAYVDKIGTVSISVSEQPVPASFQGNTDGQVAQLAKSYSATDNIDANGTKVYIGTSAKGPQSTIFTKNNLLILIKSTQKIDDGAWVSYINSLN